MSCSWGSTQRGVGWVGILQRTLGFPFADQFLWAESFTPSSVPVEAATVSLSQPKQCYSEHNEVSEVVQLELEPRRSYFATHSGTGASLPSLPLLPLPLQCLTQQELSKQPEVPSQVRTRRVCPDLHTHSGLQNVWSQRTLNIPFFQTKGLGKETTCSHPELCSPGKHSQAVLNNSFVKDSGDQGDNHNTHRSKHRWRS